MLDRDTVAIAHLEGPERVQGEWWKDRAAYARDYWIAQLADGRRAWLYSEQFSAGGEGRPALARRWFLHGWVEVGTSVSPAEPEPRATVLRFPGVGPAPVPRVVPRSAPRYAELLCRSNYSFSEGASFPEELVERAAALGLSALAITDRDGLYGAVRAHRAAKASPVALLHGALLSVENGASLVALVQNLDGWSTLCRLLSAERLPPGQSSLDAFSIGIPGDPRHADPLVPDAATLAAGQHAGKGWPRLPLSALLADNQGLVLLARGAWTGRDLDAVRDAVGSRLYRAVSRRLDPGESDRIDALVAQDLPCVAVGDVLYHDRGRQPLQDILACIRLGLTLDLAGRRLQPNAERSLHGPAEMARRFARWPELLDRTLDIAGQCQFSLKELTYQYPREVVPSGYSAQAWLRELVRRGLMTRYGAVVPEKVARQVEYELGVVERLGFAAYFLTVNDLVRFARGRGILCQGRGSAANSAVCFALGITSVDPAHSSLLFERFISEERGEPPDIDVDFEHERREEVIQYCYQKYGRDRAAMVNEIVSYRGRSAVRAVGKACGLGLDQVDRLCGLLDSWGKLAEGDEVLKEAGLDPAGGRVSLAMKLGREIQGFPRHTSIHVGGFVISDGPLVDRAPVEPATMAGRTVIQWDKDDVDELGFVKVDCLALGMLTAIRKCFDLVRASTGQHYDLGTVPREDPAVYTMLGEADSIGVFQVESRAQQGMLPRLKPKNFYDLVIEVSVVRPGPIQGGMVHPYLRRRQGLEEVEYADPRLVPILERTLGVPIFQEQVMAMAVAVGGFTPGEADQLRRAMGAWRKRGGLGELTERLMGGLLSNGLALEYAERVCKQIQGFAEYGFPESHAASFAHLVYVSAWQRCFFPAAFTAALINSQPMGFYAPRTLVADIERHGVEVRPVDVTVSDWDCTIEPGADGPAIRLGLRLVKGLGETDARLVVKARGERPFDSLPDLAVRTGIDRGALRALARADALRWLPVIAGVVDRPVDPQPRRAMAFAADGLWPGMFARLSRGSDAEMPEATPAEELQSDYATVGLKPGTHPLALARPALDRDQVVPLSRLYELPDGAPVVIAGLVGVRQRPDTSSGVIFLMLEDETGTANVVVWPKLYKRQRTTIRTERLLRVWGVLQRMDGAISIVARHVRPMTIGADIVARSRDFQ
ncbi:MAG: error-prone DNA polymerase [Deltaproteobacteria bacterium]|nr:error-prone DNA polymerase [Deltaproteobacteria bacterium]